MKWFTNWKKNRLYKKSLKPILTGNAKMLGTKCKEALDQQAGTCVAGKLEDVARSINAAAKKHGGQVMACAGLAANQIGIDARVFIVSKTGGGFRRYINPVVIKRSLINIPRVEICFSNKKPYAVLRSKTVTIKALGMLTPKTLTGIEAWAFQHEMDHLEGIVYK